MKILSVITITILVSMNNVFCNSPPAPPDPVGTYDFADPVIVFVNGTYYAYTNGGTGMYSKDIIHWSRRTPFLTKTAPWSKGTQKGGGAPGLSQTAQGTWVIYFQNTPNNHTTALQCIGAAVSTTPAGPFKPQSEPLVCMPEERGAIDASSRLWENGIQQLYWKSTGYDSLERPSKIWTQKLSRDGLRFDGPRTLLMQQTETWEAKNGIGCTEAPSMLEYPKGKFTLFYSGGDWTADWYAIGYCICESSFGPCTKQTTDKTGPWFKSYNRTAGPGSCEEFLDEDGKPWLAFHGWDSHKIGYDKGGERMLRIYPFSELPPFR